MLEAIGTVNRRAFHLMSERRPEAAMRVLLAQYMKDPNEPRDPLEDYVPGMLDLARGRRGRLRHAEHPRGAQVELRMKTIGASQFVGDVARFKRLAPPMLERLKRESGLADYEELSSMAPGERLPEAFRRVQERYDADSRARARPFAVRGDARGFPTVRDAQRSSRPRARQYDFGSCPRSDSARRAFPGDRRDQAHDRFLAAGGAGPLLSRATNRCSALIERLEEPDGAGLGELYRRSMRLRRRSTWSD